MTLALDPDRTALLVVDMQYFDASPEAGEGETARALGVLHYFDEYFAQIDRITLVIADLLAIFRAKQMEVMHLRVAERTKDSRDVGHKQLVRGLVVPIDSKEAEFLPGLEPVDDEIVINKSSSGVFAVTELDRILRNIGIETLVFVGTSTGGCVQSAVFDATDLGYRVLVVEDACADSTEASHATCVARTREQAVEVVTAAELHAALSSAADGTSLRKSGLERVKPYLPKAPFLSNPEDGQVEPYSTIFGPAIQQSIEPDSVALLLLDVQRLTCDPDYRAPGLMPDAPHIAEYYLRVSAALGSMSKLLEASRAHGVPVIHARTSGNLSQGRDLSPKRQRQGVRIGPQDPASEIMPQVAPHPGEAVLNKPGSSAFNGTGLDTLLRNCGIRTLLMAGISVDNGLEATMRSAGDRGYGTVVVLDACAADAPAIQRLAGSERGINNVRSVAETAAELQTACAGGGL